MKKTLILLQLFISITGFTQVGRIGINTTAPSALLHVMDSSVIFTGGLFLPVSPVDPPASGFGIRMMWYPDKAAFRAGRSTFTGWDKINIGDYSFAAGEGTKASGSHSFAAGNGAIATGIGAVSFGRFNGARAFASVAIGQFNDSISSSSPNSWVDTDPVFIIGNGADFNNRSNAFIILKNGKTGINTSFPQAMLHVKDSSVVFTGPQVLPPVPGNTPVSGSGFRMMWYPDKAAFRAGIAVNQSWDRDFIGNFSFAAGRGTIAQGSGSAAFGNSSSAIGINSFVTGDGYASGYSSVAMGSGVTAVGASSFAIGALTKATGDYTFAHGFSTIARSYSSFVIGQNNDSVISSSISEWVETDPLFIIGNGLTNNTRNNAVVVYKNGNVTFDGELNRTPTGNANIAPVCYGSVSNAGAINSGTGNFTVNKTATGQYEISITGELYSSSGYTANVTVNSFSFPRMAVTSASAGNLLVVRIWDIAGALVDAGFHFIVYKQ